MRQFGRLCLSLGAINYEICVSVKASPPTVPEDFPDSLNEPFVFVARGLTRKSINFVLSDDFVR
jgi:hypothetical protein